MSQPVTESDPSPDERTTSLIKPVDLPDTFSEDDIYIMKRLLHGLHAALMIASGQEQDDPDRPLLFRALPDEIPHPDLIDVAECAIFTMTQNCLDCISKDEDLFRRELLAQAMRQELGYEIDQARDRTAEMIIALDIEQDQRLLAMKAMTSDGFQAFLGYLFEAPGMDDEMVAQQGITTGIRAIFALIFQMILRDTERILEDLDIEPTKEAIAEVRAVYREAFMEVTEGSAE